ncbi:MAG: peptidylprolyl isomerase [Planctomycetota bacterium]|nr:peptidylprolyl isomerase [Planctomycetota bacterium]
MTNRTACAVERSGLPTTQFTFVEALEGRLLLNGVPSFATALGAQYSVAATGQALAIGIDGAADSGDALTITALSDDPNLQAIVLPDTRFAQLHFVAADGTDIGDVLVELFDSRAPTAAERFATLATTGYDSGGLPDATASPFYTDVLVHRIIPNFMVQTGDAQKGDGTGGSPLGAFNETLDPNLSFSGVGVLAMANSGGPSSSDCQFFITNTAAHWLDGNYIIFGQVISGMDIVSTLIDLPRDSDDRPYGVPVLQSVSIIGSDQDGVVLLIPQAGFDGSATVTISLNDEGTSQTTSQDIAVVSDPPAGSMGVITLPEQETFASPGSSFQFTAQISPPSGVTTMHVAVESDKPGVTASIDPVTYEVTVNVAGDFTGAARLRVTAWPDGYDNYANWPPAEGVVYVNATGQVTIDDPGLLHVAPGVESTFTATASGQPTGLEATTSLTGAAVSTEPGLQYNITAPADFTGVFQAQLTASQGTLITGESGYVQAATRSVTVSSQNAADPPALQAILGATNGTSYATVVDGNTLYEADGALGLRIYDISDPQAPVFLGSYGTLGQLRDLKLIHRTISGSDHTIALLADIYSGIISVDVTDPTDPAVLDTVTLNSSGGEYAVALAVAGNVAYVAEYGGGLVAYDITDPAQITKLGSAIVGSEAVGIAILGRYAFVSDANGGSSDTDGWAGVIVVDIAKPAAMNAVSSYSTDVLLGQWGSPWGLTVAGNRLYVADQTNGLLVYDMANPVKGKYLGRFADDSPPWQVTVANQVALITGEGVKFIDASNPANMSVLYSYQTPDWVGQIGAYRGHLALPVSSLGVVLMDASDLLNHTTVSTSATFISDSGVPVTVKISGGGKLVVTTTGSGAGDIIGIDVVNSTAKTSVSISAKTSLPYSIGGITVDGSIAKFLAPGADLAGDFVVQGVIGTLSLHNVTGYDITLHDNAALSVVATTQAAITANNVTDCQLRLCWAP